MQDDLSENIDIDFDLDCDFNFNNLPTHVNSFKFDENNNTSSPEKIFEIILNSNRIALTKDSKYPTKENPNLKSLYKFTHGCPCNNCTFCNENGCNGHWVIDEKATIKSYALAYLDLFINPIRHDNFKESLKYNIKPHPRIKNAVALFKKDIIPNWKNYLSEAAKHNKSLFCNDWHNDYWKNKWRSLNGKDIYLSKAFSLLHLDIVIPYDNESYSYTRKFRYSSNYFSMMNQLRDDITTFLKENKLSIDVFRQFDSLKIYGDIKYRPLSRILDKRFYHP